MNITSRQLKAFLLTARHQSFSRAAEHLFITQSGMSVLIRELEGQLGFRLFERTTRKVTLTPFGYKFLPIADRSLVDLEAAAQNIGRSASAAGHQLALGATPLIAGKLLPTAIAEYEKRDPELRIVLHDGERGRLLSMLGTGQIDLAFGCFLQPASGLRLLPLYRFSLMAIESEADAARRAGPLRWDDLVDARLIGSPPEMPIQQLIERQLARVGRRRPPELTLTFFETQIAMAEVGAGVAVVPTFAIPACRGHKVVMHRVVDPEIPVDFVSVVGRGRRLPPRAEGFTSFLKSYIAEWAEPWSAPSQRAA